MPGRKLFGRWASPVRSVRPASQSCRLRPTRVFTPNTDVPLKPFLHDQAPVVRPGGVVAAAVWDTFGGMPSRRMFWDTVAALHPAAEPRRSDLLIRPMTRPNELQTDFQHAGISDVTLSVHPPLHHGLSYGPRDFRDGAGTAGDRVARCRADAGVRSPSALEPYGLRSDAADRQRETLDVANLRHRAKRSRHHTKHKQRFIVSVVTYDSLPGHRGLSPTLCPVEARDF
jgi:hypothetical protein